MTWSELVERGQEDLDRDTVTIEADGIEVTLPELEARIILKGFVDMVENEIKRQGNVEADKTNSTAHIIENNDLLDEGEMREILASNSEAYGRFEGMKEARLILVKKLNEFFGGDSNE